MNSGILALLVLSVVLAASNGEPQFPYASFPTYRYPNNYQNYQLAQDSRFFFTTLTITLGTSTTTSVSTVTTTCTTSAAALTTCTAGRRRRGVTVADDEWLIAPSAVESVEKTAVVEIESERKAKQLEYQPGPVAYNVDQANYFGGPINNGLSRVFLAFTSVTTTATSITTTTSALTATCSSTTSYSTCSGSG